MWGETTRKQYERQGARSACELTEGEWALIAPLVPAAKQIGRPRTTVLRAVINALFYLLSTGCRLRMRPKAAYRGPGSSRSGIERRHRLEFHG